MHLSWSASAVGDTDALGRHGDDLGGRTSSAPRTDTATETDAASPAPPPGVVLPASAP
ncbi:hypothetical protein [Cellulosimicrobium cellulans]|uniref:hypothetical protein n=1 Tax=Cellulosimicrobium cellulans TaxID=1710 RepID=UPI0014954BC2|nr:hypothetical protein [Cellulosimicrobium cellulans]